VKFFISLLIVTGLTLHMVHAGPSFAGTETAEASNAVFTPEQPHDATFGVSPAVPHCHPPGSCAFLSVKLSTLLREPASGDLMPGLTHHPRSKIVHRQFRPPRLPAHA
jgi:hypothetical protein